MRRDADSSLSHYVQAARAYPELSRERELELATRWITERDESAREELIRSHLRYVVGIALKYHGYGVPLSELVAEGNFGLVNALQKFEINRGNRFLTYATYWIRAYVFDYITRSWSMVGGGSGALRTRMFFRLRRERARIANLVGEGDHADELLAESLCLPRRKVAAMVHALDARDLSLDGYVSADSTVTLGETLPAGDASQEEHLMRLEVRGRVHTTIDAALTSLDARERYIVEKRLMADREDELSVAELGEFFGVSRERARQLENRAKTKMRKSIEKGFGVPVEFAMGD